MRVRERDLSHEADPVRFGNAMLKCEGFGPDCSFSGRCMHDGECFVSAPNLVAARMIEALAPNQHERGMHFAYLRRCAELLREGKVIL